MKYDDLIHCGVPLDRRRLLQSISAIALTPVLSDPARAKDAAVECIDRQTHPLRIDKRYMLFPVNNDALPRRVRLMKNGKVLRSFTASLGLPAQWWAHLDVSEWRDETLVLSLEIDKSPPKVVTKITGRGAGETGNAELAAAVLTSATIWSPGTLYQEPLRPQFHFSSRRGWNNDPNGLMYHDGQYHMFFQHNPYGVCWGNMHWGHAVSPDLVHWKELPIALYPRGNNDFPYSGSGVVDHEIRSGWSKDGRPPMIIAFTSTGRGECIAYSNDDGATWIEYEGNPVIKHDGRDPKLFWHAPSKQWVIAVYSLRAGKTPSAPKRNGIAFYTSTDLRSWSERSWIDDYYECPDIFALPVDGDASRMKWVLSCAPGHYSIGEFDGTNFRPETPRLPSPVSKQPSNAIPPPFYAAQTFSDHPDGKCVQLAWGGVETAGIWRDDLGESCATIRMRS